MACAAVIDQHLDAFITTVEMPRNLADAIRYALLGGGKRLRPVLAWHSCIAAGGTGEASLPAATALELIHAFSLVHDDLPAMDDDDLRRGRPTLHIHAGEAMAILAGDAMITLSFEHLVKECAPQLGAQLVHELSAATTAMIAGQVHDTVGGFAPGLSERERLELIHRNKTAALIRAACRMGAMCAAVDRDERGSLDALTAYGEAVGLMYQIVDDLLDVEASPQQAGKQTGKDRVAGKLTYPGVLGVEASRREVQRLEGDALAAIAPLGPRAGALGDLCRYMARRTT